MAEILAPVGGYEQLYAAVRCGANAVYLGTKDFNARRNASNFDFDELAEAVKYCHVRDVSVYSTVNTLVFDDEIKALEETAEKIAFAGVDGVIIQDLAVLELFKKRYPGIIRVASTQMAVHNVSGAKMVEELGFDTLVLARELSKKEIIDIINHTSIRTEVFVHGAHCMSLSGACYVSSMLGGRSGNRGLCAQPCRLDWKSGDRDYALSLKDLSLISHLKELEDIGVDSFKIEGRMKRPEYVAAVVSACRKSLNGEEYDFNQLEAVFSRSGFTEGYYQGKITKDMFGIRTKDDVMSSAAVLKNIEQAFSKENPLVPVYISVDINEKRSTYKLSDNRGNSVTVTGNGGDLAIKKETSAEDVRKNSVKFGGTPFYEKGIDVSIKDGLYYPVSELNSLRREAVEQLTRAREHVGNTARTSEENSPVMYSLPVLQINKEKWGRFSSIHQVFETDYFDRYIIPLYAMNEAEDLTIDPHKVMIEIPPVLFPSDEEKATSGVQTLKAKGYDALYVNNLYGVYLSQKLGFEAHGGFGLNVTNTSAIKQYSSMGLKTVGISFEVDAERIKDIKHTVPTSVIVYGRLPLMRYRACPIKVSIGCGQCKAHGEITDRYGNRFPIECWDQKTSSLLNSVPMYIVDKKPLDADAMVYWFTNESADEVKHIVEVSSSHMKPDFKRTTGLYYREVL